MKVNELIKELEEFRKFRGNVEVTIEVDDEERPIRLAYEHDPEQDKNWRLILSDSLI